MVRTISISADVLKMRPSLRRRSCRYRVTSLEQVRQAVAYKAYNTPASYIHAHEGVVNGEAFKDGHSMRDTITAIQHDTSCAA